jgi:hypothetical protein
MRRAAKLFGQVRKLVVGAGRYRSTVRIKFDGFRSATSLHSTYIEPVAEKEGAASQDRRLRKPACACHAVDLILSARRADLGIQHRAHGFT